jgi:hypothetical protein
MEIKEIKDDHWIIEIDHGRIYFDLNSNKAFFFKKRSKVFKDEVEVAPIREWQFNVENYISGLDILLVIMKSLHL